VSPQQHRKAVCGVSRATKREEHRALVKLAETIPILDYQKMITNEAKRDALCVGLCALLRAGK
jgi:Holliday junction resolvasome RuvABC endonuclease subunit